MFQNKNSKKNRWMEVNEVERCRVGRASWAVHVSRDGTARFNWFLGSFLYIYSVVWPYRSWVVWVAVVPQQQQQHVNTPPFCFFHYSSLLFFSSLFFFLSVYFFFVFFFSFSILLLFLLRRLDMSSQQGRNQQLAAEISRPSLMSLHRPALLVLILFHFFFFFLPSSRRSSQFSFRFTLTCIDLCT